MTTSFFLHGFYGACPRIAPKRNPNNRQKPCDVGLFDEVSRNQIDLLDYLAEQQSPVKS